MTQQDEGTSLPPAVGKVNGESDTIAKRAGVELRASRRPIPAEPIDPPPDLEQKVEDERREAATDDEEIRPDAEPTD
ncbi:hypothetical protein ACFMQL_32800 [Nonomuraea fastidiosa]|jgi:hypothetical protein|uniref:hypothetical protein n=1 Tax=Nonomuraea TaxID=83681 RepID=UPI00325634AE